MVSSTKKTYGSGGKQYLNFCALYRPEGSILPADETVLIEFCTFLAKSVKQKTIKTYLAAVRHFHIRAGFDLDFSKFPRLQLVLKGIKRVQGDSIRIRLPITTHHLRLFYFLLCISTTTNHDSLMIWAAMTLAFFGFLRLGELTCNSSHFSQDIHLCASDIVFVPNTSNPQYISVSLKASKTDPFRQGQIITIGATGELLCPVKALKKYLAARAVCSLGPLFRYRSGKFLTKAELTSELRALLSRAGLNSNNYAGHSFRIGAATSAAAKDIPAWLIKVLGRWTSDCFQRYIQTPQSVIASISAKLVG